MSSLLRTQSVLARATYMELDRDDDQQLMVWFLLPGDDRWRRAAWEELTLKERDFAWRFAEDTSGYKQATTRFFIKRKVAERQRTN